MALVTSDETITVIILEHKAETEALTNLLEWATGDPQDNKELQELTNALIGAA